MGVIYLSNIAIHGNIDSHFKSIDRNSYLSSIRWSVIGMDNTTVARNFKIGIMKDLHSQGLLTQKQMELAIMRINRSEERGQDPTTSFAKNKAFQPHERGDI